MKKILQNKYLIIELIIIFILTLVNNLTNILLSGDEIWNYGFSYNISTRLIPYKDFNMVVTPLFPLLGSIFMVIFGKTLFVYHIFNTLICTSIFYLIKKIYKKTYYVTYFLFLISSLSLPNYNFFCVLLLFLLMLMEDKKSNDYLIGVVLGLTFLTKQNIGIMLCIPTLFTKDIKKIIKRIIGFLIPNIIFLIYLLISNTLYEFLDYCLFGLSSFAIENLLVRPFIIFTVISIIYLIYKYIKKKDGKLLYLFCFQIMAYPLFDMYHCLISFVPVLGYFINELKINKKIWQIEVLIFVFAITLNNLNLINKEEIYFQTEPAVYQYRLLVDNNVNEHIKTISYYVKENNNKKVYILSADAYIYKLEAKLQLTKYDLLNDGNLGRNGDEKIINEWKKICEQEKCIFLIDKDEIKSKFSQTNKKILNYIMNNYKENDKICGFSIYESEVQNEK